VKDFDEPFGYDENGYFLDQRTYCCLADNLINLSDWQFTSDITVVVGVDFANEYMREEGQDPYYYLMGSMV
jgi:hypothetical protein